MGNIAVFALTICLFTSAAFAQTFWKDWRLVRDVEGVKTFLHRSDIDVTGAVQVNENKTATNWSKIKKEEFLKSLEENKKQALSLIGVTEWTASEYIWNNQNDITELLVVGTYKNSASQFIQFRELHIFKEKKTIQVLYTQPVGAKVSSKTGENFVASVVNNIGE
ncbi:MAG: hypothetical protein ACXVCL_11630 [Bdellovibrio sp.]